MGSIKYFEAFDSNTFTTKFHSYRIGVIPPKCGIGEYRLIDSNEFFILLNPRGVHVTVNGKTGLIYGDSLIPVKPGDSIGIYNPTEKDATFAWGIITEKKGEYHTIDLGNNLSEEEYMQPTPFPWVPLDHGKSRQTNFLPQHEGRGFLYFAADSRIGGDYNPMVIYLIIPPGSSIGYHQHYAQEEFYFIIQGSGRATVDDVTLDQKRGDCTLCTVNSAHGIFNNTEEDLEVILFGGILADSQTENSTVNLGDDLSTR